MKIQVFFKVSGTFSSPLIYPGHKNTSNKAKDSVHGLMLT